MGCIESSRGVHTAQRPTQTQIPIGFNFCANLSVSLFCLGLCIGQCKHTINITGFQIVLTWKTTTKRRPPRNKMTLKERLYWKL